MSEYIEIDGLIVRRDTMIKYFAVHPVAPIGGFDLEQLIRDLEAALAVAEDIRYMVETTRSRSARQCYVSQRLAADLPAEARRVLLAARDALSCAA